MYSIGADIGGSHISTCLFEHSYKRLLLPSMVTERVDRLGGREEILSSWSYAISVTRKNANKEVKGVGLAMPGPFDYFNGISLIRGVDKFESLYNIDIRAELAKRVNLQPVNIRFINDASAFTIAESLMGEASAYQRCLGITLGTGFGSAFTENGKPVITRHDVPAGGFLYDKLFENNLADEVFSTRGLIKRFQRRSGILCESVQQIALKAAEDKTAKETFLEFGSDLGRFLLPYLQTFDAQVLVLGGNICRAYYLFQEPLHQQLQKYNVYVSSLGEKAAMIGAARLLDDDYYDQIKETLKEM